MGGRCITVIRGDGIGPSIVDATVAVLDRAGCGFAYEYVDGGLAALEARANSSRRQRWMQ